MSGLGWIRQLRLFELRFTGFVVLNSDDPLYPSNHEARSVSNRLLIILDRKNHCTMSPKDSRISPFFFLVCRTVYWSTDD